MYRHGIYIYTYIYIYIVYIYIMYLVCIYCRRKFWRQTSDLWTDAATVVWVVRKEKESEGKESVERSSRCTKSETLFQMICGSRGSKSRLAKAAGAEPSWPDEKLHGRCGAKHISKSKCTKHQLRTTFGSWDVEKVHSVVARSTLWS